MRGAQIPPCTPNSWRTAHPDLDHTTPPGQQLAQPLVTDWPGEQEQGCDRDLGTPMVPLPMPRGSLLCPCPQGGQRDPPNPPSPRAPCAEAGAARNSTEHIPLGASIGIGMGKRERPSFKHLGGGWRPRGSQWEAGWGGHTPCTHLGLVARISQGSDPGSSHLSQQETWKAPEEDKPCSAATKPPVCDPWDSHPESKPSS